MLLAFVGAGAALVGGYWDDAWHTERGRDEFLIAPHIAIYAGIATAGAALTVWALLVARRSGPKAVLAHKPLVLGLLSVGVTLASGPIDNAWHIAFGRDAVIWSPPHMLGLAGTLALAASLLAELATRPEPWARTLCIVAGALVIAPAAFSTVEYDTDVPQFSALWYLPVLGFAVAIAMAMVRIASTQRWGVTLATAAYSLLVGGVAVGLLALHFPPPALPLLIAPAVAVDVGARRSWSPLATATAFALALYLAYVPARNWLGDGVEFTAFDVLLGLPLTILACWAVFAVAAGRLLIRPLSVVGSVLVALAIPGAAVGHDPGQGDDAGSAEVTVSIVGSQARLSAVLDQEFCSATTPIAVTARRGGQVIRGPMQKLGCSFEGSVVLPDRGRWFVYAEMSRDGEPVETWLPITAGDGPEKVLESSRYVYSPIEQPTGPAKLILGALLYAGMLALIMTTFALIRSSAPGGPAKASSPSLRRGRPIL